VETELQIILQDHVLLTQVAEQVDLLQVLLDQQVLEEQLLDKQVITVELQTKELVVELFKYLVGLHLQVKVVMAVQVSLS